MLHVEVDGVALGIFAGLSRFLGLAGLQNHHLFQGSQHGFAAFAPGLGLLVTVSEVQPAQKHVLVDRVQIAEVFLVDTLLSFEAAECLEPTQLDLLNAVAGLQEHAGG